MTTELILLGKLIIKGKIVLKTGLHIGGTSTDLNIGGVDNSVIKTANGVPYIPGSSLKGKLRSLMARATYELTRKNFPENRIHSCSNVNCSVCSIFGRDTKDMAEVEQPNRLIVRDSFLDIEFFEKLINDQELKNLDLEFTEVKYENFIDRLTSAANPRQLERVPPSNKFDFEMIFNFYSDVDFEHLRTLLSAMKLLEDDYLGGSGTRGSGKIKFEDILFEYRTKEYYEEKIESKKIEELTELSALKFEELKKLIK